MDMSQTHYCLTCFPNPPLYKNLFLLIRAATNDPFSLVNNLSIISSINSWSASSVKRQEIVKNARVESESGIFKYLV